VALARLKRPSVGQQAVILVSDLAELASFHRLIEAMRQSPRQCALTYNRAVAAYPQAGVTPLAITPEWIELPLWACRWARPRQRVLADVTREPSVLVTPDGTPIDPQSQTLLPRALTLTALMRSALCEFFIHGRGGGLYDRVTETWWQYWQGSALAPTAVVSADARLPFEVPLADRRQLASAKWHAHHAPHNVDRLLDLDGPMVREKQRLIAQMQRSRDRRTRWLSFCAIHRINAALVEQHPTVVGEPEQQLHEARQGLLNRAVAEKRDWCFAFYSKQQLQQIVEQLKSA
jgi:hypothetical protein